MTGGAPHPAEWTSPPCAMSGPPPFPGAMSYYCSLDAGHDNAHEAWAGDRFCDSWPQADEAPAAAGAPAPSDGRG